MANEKWLIDANALLAELDKFVNPLPDAYGLHFLNGLSTAITEIEDAPTVDAVEVVRCKDCKSAEPYTRMNGKTGFYCKHQKCTLRYGTNWERLYMPIKEADDFCSYGERREGE